MGRSKKQLMTTHDLFIIGEQLRTQLTGAGLVKDQRHHLRKHRKCFVAKDAVDWLLRMHHVDSRQDAVAAMSMLQEFKVVHHVSDEQEFQDKNFLFRFTKDDDSYLADRDLASFYSALDIYNKLKQPGSHVMREFYNQGELHRQAFYGSDAVDFLLQWERTGDREMVVGRLQDLQARGILRHLADDCPFLDDRLIYEFGIDFFKPCLLTEVLDIVDSLASIEVERSDESNNRGSENEEDEEDEEDQLSSFVCVDSAGSVLPHQSARVKGQSQRGPPSGSLPVQSERVLHLTCDAIGYGMVLRGCAPCYVHRTDPWGPASRAKVKNGQAISSVNTQPVYHLDHRQVSLLVAQCEGQGSTLDLGVIPSRKHRTPHS